MNGRQSFTHTFLRRNTHEREHHHDPEASHGQAHGSGQGTDAPASPGSCIQGGRAHGHPFEPRTGYLIMWAIFDRAGVRISATYATQEEAETVKRRSLLYIDSDVVRAL